MALNCYLERNGEMNLVKSFSAAASCVSVQRESRFPQYLNRKENKAIKFAKWYLMKIPLTGLTINYFNGNWLIPLPIEQMTHRWDWKAIQFFHCSPTEEVTDFLLWWLTLCQICTTNLNPSSFPGLPIWTMWLQWPNYPFGALIPPSSSQPPHPIPPFPSAAAAALPILIAQSIKLGSAGTLW